VDVNLVQIDEAYVSYDGQFQLPLEQGDKIVVQRAKQEVTLIHPSDYCYFEMLRNKLNWG
jgi:NAD+ kinase